MADAACGAIAMTCSCLEAIGLPAVLIKEASTFLCLERNWSDLKKVTEDLQATEARIKEKVILETNQLNMIDPQVELWQRRVADYLEEEAEITEEDYKKLYRCYCLCNCTPN